MENTTEEVIEIPYTIKQEPDSTRIDGILSEIVDMFFEVFISFIPIVLYWLLFYISGNKIDFYEHIKMVVLYGFSWLCL